MCGKENKLYETFSHQGKTIAEWHKDFKGVYSLEELCRMARGGIDFHKMSLQHDNIISGD